MNDDNTKALGELAQAQAHIDTAVDAMQPTPPAPASTLIDTPDAFDRALSTVKAGDVLTLAATFEYRRPLVLTSSGFCIEGEGVTPGRMTRDAPLPRFLGGVRVRGNGLVMRGVDMRHTDPLVDVVVIEGMDVTLDRARVLGDQSAGAKRGIAANHGGNLVLVQCFVDDCMGAYPDPKGNDRQALCAWDMGPGLLIEDCYLSGGTETVMIGGADPSSPERAPRGITIIGCTLTKNPAWQASAISVKNTLELKNARDVRIVENTIEYSWGGRGQTGYALMLTPRNHGAAPTSTVEDVLIRGNRFAHAAAAISILGSDDNRVSGRLQRVRIEQNVFEDLDPVRYTGSQKMIQIQRGPRDVKILNNVFKGKNLTSQVYFDGLPMCEELVITGNTWPRTKYGVFGSGASVVPGKAWQLFVSSGELANNTEV